MLNFGKGKTKEKKEEKSKYNKKLNDYRIEGTIGEGAYGKVKNATHIATGEKVAIKFINKNRLIRAGDNDRMLNEMKIITELNHPNILKAFEIFDDEINFYIIMEKPEKGDLFNYICSKGRLSLDEGSFIYYQIVNGITYLENMKIAHRDLKPENILLTSDMIVKIGDFGLSKYYKNENIRMETNCGSPCYSAPEMLRGNRYKPLPIDVWGIGVIFYCMICGQLPFEDEREDVLIRKVTQCEYSCPYFVNQNVRNLFKKILVPNPNDRMTMTELKANCVYNMGKANFIKSFKIYGDDGDLLPQVKKFVKEKSLKSMEVACSMEINQESEKETPYKIFYYKYMHKTPWNEYHIPKEENKEIERIPEEEIKVRNQMKTGDKKTKGLNSSHKESPNKLSTFSDIAVMTNTLKNNYWGDPNQTTENKDDNEDLLSVPEYGNLAENDNVSNRYNEYLTQKIDDKMIDAIRKFGIIEHSFDKNFTPKLKGDN